ncbi:phage major capsid protein [Tistrella bauzanensis]|uniref:phage major capsid protein n=1 Tax=Tistrella TaxID=171436 RepID=UPI0031F69F30
MDPELKALLDKQMQTFEDFKKANDAAQHEIKTLKSEDALTKAKVDRISAALDKIDADLKEWAAKSSEIEKQMGRLRIGGNGGPALDSEVKAAADMSLLTGAQMAVDDYRSYKAAFDGSMRRGHRLGPDEVKALSVGSDPDGGYLVPADVSGRMITRIYETSAMRQLASVATIGTDRLEGPVDRGEADYGWVGETQPRTVTGTSTIGMWGIPVHEMWAFPETTQKLLDDAQFDVEGWLISKVTDKLTRAENTAFFVGNGTLKPRGILDYPRATTADDTRADGIFQYFASGTNGSLGAATAASDKLIDLVYSIKAPYRTKATFAMSRGLVGTVRKIKDGQGNYAWQPSLQALQAGTLLGYPIAEAEDMPALASNGPVIGFGDFSAAYQIVDRVGIRLLRDNLTHKGFVGFYVTRRVGGGALDFEAVKYLQASAS